MNGAFPGVPAALAGDRLEGGDICVAATARGMQRLVFKGMAAAQSR